ncbi:hypothetical protein V6O07_03800, partial [Arthrospira platensis SPKY2]
MPMLAPGAPIPSYQMGGAIGPGGQPQLPAGLQQTAPQGPMPPEMMEMQLQQFSSQNPQAVQQIRSVINQALASGDIEPQQLNMLAQIATTAMRSPELYPQLRQMAIQQGVADEEDMPPEFDQGFIISILLAAQAMQADVGGQDMMAGGQPPMPGGQPPIPSYEAG